MPKYLCIGDPKPEVKWIKVDGELSSRVQLEETFLIIPRITQEDQGTYRCVASSAAGRVFAQVTIIVEGSLVGDGAPDRMITWRNSSDIVQEIASAIITDLFCQFLNSPKVMLVNRFCCLLRSSAGGAGQPADSDYFRRRSRRLDLPGPRKPSADHRVEQARRRTAQVLRAASVVFLDFPPRCRAV